MSKICLGCMESYSDEFTICPSCGYAEGTKATEALHMEPGSILQGRYVIGKVLGFGGFGVTYIGWDALLEQKVAVKEYLPSEFSTRIPGQTQVTVFNGDKAEQYVDGLKKFVDEAQRLAKFHSLEGIVRIFDSFADNNTAYIVMECLEGETLAERLKRVSTIPPDEAIALMIPVIKSLNEVHGLGIIHRDIAPDNIFLTKDGQAKLIDFGAARFATTSLSRSLTVIIKPGYSPEEQYRSRGDQGAYTDVYAIGATLYTMITGMTPPDALERRAFFESKRKDILRPLSAFCKDITEDQETAILNALNVRIEDRTQDMAALEAELSGGDSVERKHGRISKIDVLKWPIGAKIAAIAAALAVVVLSSLFALGVIGFNPDLKTVFEIPSDMSRVPSIVNNDLEEAESRLNSEGPPQVQLLYSIVGKENSSDVPADRILTQDLGAGTIVPHNTVVKITISAGAETNTVPDTTGMNVKEAKQMLEDLGFVVDIETEHSLVVAENAVISQSVAGNSKLEIGAGITLLVSRGLGDDFVAVMTRVPDFAGMTYEDAKRLAQDAGFVLSISSKEFSDEYDVDIVMSQSVPADIETLNGITIELVISKGQEIIEVPDIQYKTEAEARERLEKLGLIVETTYEVSEIVESGLVISQSEAMGSMLRPGDTVILIVSSGATVTMPNLVGMSEASARAALNNSNLSVSVSYEASDSTPSGNVIRQSSQANAEVNRGATVTIIVSIGPASTTSPSASPSPSSGASPNPSITPPATSSSPPDSGRPVELVTVPNVVGQSESSARNTLSGQGFSVLVSEAYSDSTARGNVMTQYPAAGTSQQKGATITLTISKGSEPPTVQNVVGRTLSAAETALNNQGFNVRIVEENSDSVSKGNVISQSPSGGATANRGDTITLTVSLGPRNPTIPNVVGQSRSSATSTLRDLGFSVDYREESSDSVPMDSVISQSPAAGATAAPGSWITLTISKGKEGPPTDLILDPVNMTLTEGSTQQIVAVVMPTNAIDKTIRWESNDTSVATVSSNGLVTARQAGFAAITATTNSGNITRVCYVTVDKKEIRRIEVSSMPSIREYSSGEMLNTAGLTIRITFVDNTTELATSGFMTSPDSGSVLSNSGLYAIQQPIDVTYYGFTQRGLFSVTVNPISVSGVDVSPFSLTISVNQTSALTATIYPSNAVDKTVTWSSSNESVASVSSRGEVTGNAAGTAVITATSNDNRQIKGTCQVTVSRKEYTVTFNTAGGSASQTSQTVNEGSFVVLPQAARNFTLIFNPNGGNVSPTSANLTCTFNGWYTAATGGSSVSSPYTPTANVTLYAQYANPTAGPLPTPTRENYTFTGWFTSPSGGAPVSNSTTITDSITIYAQWTENAVAPPVLQSIVIASPPGKTTYEQGESFSAAGLSVIAIYSDGSSKDVTSSVSLGGVDTNTPGSKTVTVTYSDGWSTQSTTFAIFVNEPPPPPPPPEEEEG